jgi:hypothetical protein
MVPARTCQRREVALGSGPEGDEAEGGQTDPEWRQLSV